MVLPDEFLGGVLTALAPLSAARLGLGVAGILAVGVGSELNIRDAQPTFNVNVAARKVTPIIVLQVFIAHLPVSSSRDSIWFPSRRNRLGLTIRLPHSLGW